MEGIELIRPFLQGLWIENFPSKRLSSWGAGGSIEHLFYPKNIDDLHQFFKLKHKYCKDVPVHYLGFMSNLLVRDGGLKGISLCLNRMKDIRFFEGKIYADAGASLLRLARKSQNWGQLGACFLSAIPGSVGGSLMMNAGAHGHCIWDYVASVNLLDQKGALHVLRADECQSGYRFCFLPVNGLITGATFFFKTENRQLNCSDYLLLRKKSQPVGKRSCGSVFKNPPSDFAGRLIEDLNLKGFCIGEAQVSFEHANFIVNLGQASASEIERLIKHVQFVVEKAKNVTLDLEVRIVGDALRC